MGLNWLKKILIEKYIGRLLAVALAALGGVLVSQLNLDQVLVQNWLDATKALVESALPIIIAIILGQIQHRVALYKTPPVK